MHKWKLQFFGWFFPVPTVWPQLRHEAFRAPSTILCQGVTYIPISVLHARLHTKDEEATRFLSHIHQENSIGHCWVFCVINPDRTFIHLRHRDLCIRIDISSYYLFFILNWQVLEMHRLFPLSALTALFAGECARRRI